MTMFFRIVADSLRVLPLWMQLLVHFVDIAALRNKRSSVGSIRELQCLQYFNIHWKIVEGHAGMKLARILTYLDLQ